MTSNNEIKIATRTEYARKLWQSVYLRESGWRGEDEAERMANEAVRRYRAKNPF